MNDGLRAKKYTCQQKLSVWIWLMSLPAELIWPGPFLLFNIKYVQNKIEFINQLAAVDD